MFFISDSIRQGSARTEIYILKYSPKNSQNFFLTPPPPSRGCLGTCPSGSPGKDRELGRLGKFSPKGFIVGTSTLVSYNK